MMDGSWGRRRFSVFLSLCVPVERADAVGIAVFGTAQAAVSRLLDQCNAT